MPKYTFPWKNKQALYAEFQQQPLATLDDFTKPHTIKALGIVNVEWVQPEPEDAHKDYLKKNRDDLGERFKYAIARVVADLKARNARAGLTASDLQKLNECIDEATLVPDRSIPDRLSKGLCNTPAKAEKTGDIYFQHVANWAAKLNDCFEVKKADKKPESTDSYAPFLTNLALNLTGIGFFAFVYSCYKKYTTGQYAFFDNQVIPDKLNALIDPAADSFSGCTLRAEYDLGWMEHRELNSRLTAIQDGAPAAGTPGPEAPYAGGFPLTSGVKPTPNTESDAANSHTP